MRPLRGALRFSVIPALAELAALKQPLALSGMPCDAQPHRKGLKRFVATRFEQSAISPSKPPSNGAKPGLSLRLFERSAAK